MIGIIESETTTRPIKCQNRKYLKISLNIPNIKEIKNQKIHKTINPNKILIKIKSQSQS